MTNPNYGSSGAASSRSTPPDPTDSYEALKGDISNLADSVKKLAAEHMGTAVGDAQDQMKQKLGSIESSIRKNPTQAALIAAGVGFVVGLIITR